MDFFGGLALDLLGSVAEMVLKTELLLAALLLTPGNRLQEDVYSRPSKPWPLSSLVCYHVVTGCNSVATVECLSRNWV